MTPHEERATGIGERRRSTRRDVDLQLDVSVDAQKVAGRAENISQAGVFFFSGDSVRVTVKIADGDVVKSYAGQLVRVERLSSETVGYAVEFDRV